MTDRAGKQVEWEGSHILILAGIFSQSGWQAAPEGAMLRVGLTGGLGSGKSAVAAVWRAEGVPVLEADALGRALMQPGEAVYESIIRVFGPGVVGPGGQLDRSALAREAFAGDRLAELNRLVHPAVLAAQESALARLTAEGGHLLAVVESALIFEASGVEASGAAEVSGLDSEGAAEAPAMNDSSGFKAPGNEPGKNAAASPAQLPTAPGWRGRFDRLVLIAAPEAVRLERFVARMAIPDANEAEREKLRADGRRRMAAQLSEEWKRVRCDYVIENDRTLVLLRREALGVLSALRHDARLLPQCERRQAPV